MRLLAASAACLAMVFFPIRGLRAQNQSSAEQPPVPATAPACPTDRIGVLIYDVGWSALDSATPSKYRTKGGLASSLSYGAVPASMIAYYDGDHASVEVETPQPEICLCRLISLPGDPIIVRLHPNKGLRELDAGKLRASFTGNPKLMQAQKSDLVLAEVTHPEEMTWIVRVQQSLSPGEYALMLGSQNIVIYPFTVLEPTANVPPPVQK